MSRRFFSLFIVVMLLLGSTLACSLVTGKGNDDSNTVNQPGEGAVQIDPGEPLEEGDDKDANSGDEGISVGQIKEGLDALDSYRVGFSFTSTWAESDGSQKSSMFSILNEVDKANDAQHARMSGSGEDSMENGGAFEWYRVGGQTYMITLNGDGSQPGCMSFKSDENNDQMSSIIDPDDIIGGLENAKLVKRGEMVEGIRTNRYKVDEKSIRISGWNKASGDVWVAQDGGFIVLYTGEAEGSLAQIGRDREGKLSWEYALTDVNSLPEISVPESCSQQGISDVPQPPDSSIESSFEGIVTLKSGDAPDVVADFYRSELPGQGWTLNSENSMDQLQMLEFGKDGRTLNIMISEDNGGSTIILTESK